MFQWLSPSFPTGSFNFSQGLEYAVSQSMVENEIDLVEWIENNLKFFLPKDVIITHDKAKYATTEDGTPNILIDDYGVNIQKWEAAGGIGFKHKDHKFERTSKAIKQHMQEPVEEKWSAKYKRSINCSNPKGFSQKAHCAGRKK